jgi:FkbM family methyltransferase
MPQSPGLAGLFHRFTIGASYRLKRWRLGLTPSSDLPASLGARIARKDVDLVFPIEERQVFTHECCKIFLDDCYGLASITEKIETILDIGSNLGLFSLAARHRFPRAAIHAYEPNKRLEPFLRSNLQPFEINLYLAALGSFQGRVRLQHHENSLHTVSVSDPEGEVMQDTLEQAVARLGGRVDLLKLDCEGAEWSLFERTEVWRNIGRLTMEYHLWTRPGAQLENITGTLRQFGFQNIRTFPAKNSSFGILWAARR